MRNAARFWRDWLEMRPETISPSNRYLIEQLQVNPRMASPRIDATWVEHFPEHNPFLEMPQRSRTLIHHHVGPIRYTPASSYARGFRGAMARLPLGVGVALKELEAIRTDLERKATETLKAMPAAEPDFLTAMVPASPGASEEDIRRTEHALGRLLPRTLRDVVSAYEVGGLELAGVVLGGEHTFCEFLQRQIRNPRLVWGAWRPVEDLLVIGSSPGYVVFVSVDDGRVWACLRSRAIDDRVVVASDFDKFLRALGTLMVTETVEDSEALAADLAKDVDAGGSEAFWRDRIKGYG